MSYAPLKGIDVSHYQTADKEDFIRWNDVAEDGVSFAYIRLCRGLKEEDEDTEYNMVMAIRAGIVFGLYHRVMINEGSPLEHAKFAMRRYYEVCRTTNYEPHLAFAGDYEQQRVGGGQWMADYFGFLRSALGENRMVLYSSGSYFGKYIEPVGWEGDTRLWIAHTDEWPYVGGDPARPGEKALLPGRPKFRHPQESIHQWNHKGTVNGIDGAVDLNQAMGMLPVRN